jgi:hypothetical protein
LLGQSELSNVLFSQPTNQWLGPFSSGLGWQIVNVAAITNVKIT